jgi:hypothetical protein
LMRIRKRYGDYKVDKCPLCNSVATVKNAQGIPTCVKHRKQELEGLKCSCGSWLDVQNGKYGPYFSCINCGNVKYEKGLEINGYPLMSISDL